LRARKETFIFARMSSTQQAMMLFPCASLPLAGLLLRVAR
jgi:hypothetical protein